MLISIIVPVFNTKTYLNECIDSIINQSYGNIEIIIVDDGSFDGSEKICDDYKLKDQRIKVVHQTNQGLSAARNTGIKHINGDAVAFLDSDDAYYPDFIKNMLIAMEKDKSDIVICRYTIHKTTGRMDLIGGEKIEPSFSSGCYEHNCVLRAFVDKRINSGVQNKLFKTELWDDIRFPDGHVYEDLDTIYKLFNKSNRISMINKVLFKYRIHSDSITHTWSQKSIKDLLYMF